jgi:hypothetical protein
MKPKLVRKILPGTNIPFWFCLYQGCYTSAETYKSAYNKMADRWNKTVYSDRKLPYAK